MRNKRSLKGEINMAGVYSAGDFRNGTTFEMEGNVFRVVEFQHVKPGKGAAFVRTKLKNVITGAVLEKTFNPSEKFPGAEIEKRDMQYLYNDGGLYYFMDNETYEQIPLNADQIGDGLKFLKENMNVKILSFKGNVFSVEPPMFVELEVTYTEPGFAGNTTTTSGKPATLENGYKLTLLEHLPFSFPFLPLPLPLSFFSSLPFPFPASVESSIWARTTPGTSIGWGLTCWRAA